MPFTPEDAEKHKSGLTPKKAKQWARVAESVRKRELEKGKTEEEAAASAIKQANGVVMNVNESKGKYSVYKNKQKLDYEPKLTVHQEKAHIVVPVVMMVEGVHNGSQGAIYHSIAELGKFPESWNGIPVVIYHPEEDGQAVSANSPDIIDKMTVGRVYNTEVEGKKLKAEVWLDEDKLNALSEKTLNDINESLEVEVSLGMFTENEMEEGEYEGEQYTAIAHNHRPDHLALLPDQTGACSCADGCGLGANKDCKKPEKNTDDEDEDDIVTDKKDEDMKDHELIKKVRLNGNSVNPITNNIGEGYNERMQMVNATLRKMDKEIEEDGVHSYTWHYLEEMYDEYIIYSKSGSKIDTKLYKQEYKVESGKFEFVGAPVEVHKTVDYIVNNMAKSSINSNKKGGQKMANAKDCPKCLEKINALIANTASKFEEADREWLLTQEETVLDKLAPVVETVEKVVEKTVEVNTLSDEDKAALAFGKKQMKERKDSMIRGILDNTEKVWDEQTLTAMSEDTLERVYKSVKKVDKVDFSVNAETVRINANAEDNLYPTGVEIK